MKKQNVIISKLKFKHWDCTRDKQRCWTDVRSGHLCECDRVDCPGWHSWMSLKVHFNSKPEFICCFSFSTCWNWWATWTMKFKARKVKNGSRRSVPLLRWGSWWKKSIWSFQASSQLFEKLSTHWNKCASLMKHETCGLFELNFPGTTSSESTAFRTTFDGKPKSQSLLHQ